LAELGGGSNLRSRDSWQRLVRPPSQALSSPSDHAAAVARCSHGEVNLDVLGPKLTTDQAL